MPKSKYHIPTGLKYEVLNVNGVQKFLNKWSGEICDSVSSESGSIEQLFWVKDKLEGFWLCKLTENTVEITSF